MLNTCLASKGVPTNIKNLLGKWSIQIYYIYLHVHLYMYAYACIYVYMYVP